jgi:hypothetical protein
MKAEVFIGVDVHKPRLDVTNLPTGKILEFENEQRHQTIRETRQETQTNAHHRRFTWVVSLNPR